MCLTSRIEANIDRVDAFKVFTLNKEGKLQSAFKSKIMPNLTYEPNVEITAVRGFFFALESYNTAVSVAANPSSRWLLANNRTVVLPVTLIEVVATGYLRCPSDDPQCMDGYYPSFESKKIIVHDSPEHWQSFDEAIIRNWVRRARWGLSASEKRSLCRRFPFFTECLSD